MRPAPPTSCAAVTAASPSSRRARSAAFAQRAEAHRPALCARCAASRPSTSVSGRPITHRGLSARGRRHEPDRRRGDRRSMRPSWPRWVAQPMSLRWRSPVPRAPRVQARPRWRADARPGRGAAIALAVDRAGDGVCRRLRDRRGVKQRAGLGPASLCEHDRFRQVGLVPGADLASCSSRSRRSHRRRWRASASSCWRALTVRLAFLFAGDRGAEPVRHRSSSA